MRLQTVNTNIKRTLFNLVLQRPTSLTSIRYATNNYHSLHQSTGRPRILSWAPAIAQERPAAFSTFTASGSDFFYEQLLLSLPEPLRINLLQELDTEAVIQRAVRLKNELDSHLPNPVLEDSRLLFLAALRCLKLKQISVAQLATLHITDSAIRTLYTNPVSTLIHRYVDRHNQVRSTAQIFPMHVHQSLVTIIDNYPIHHYRYNATPSPNPKIPLITLPDRFRQPLIARFFNLNASEWGVFCKEMENAPLQEQTFHTLIAPVANCWSGLVFTIHDILMCMQVLDRMVLCNNGLVTEKIMLVPSFSMFQAALNAKANTLQRKPLELVPTFGYISAEHYLSLKSAGKIALAMYLPEKNRAMRYQFEHGGFRNTIDGHRHEAAFAGALHDVYHAMRELSMSEPVAKARFRLAEIARRHPKNHLKAGGMGVDEILVDGELIFSSAPQLDTMFNSEKRANHAESFGSLFYTPNLKASLHEDLKKAFIKDMVINKVLWQEQFGLGKQDLRLDDQKTYEEIEAAHSKATTNALRPTPALRNFGLWAHSAKEQKEPVENLTQTANAVTQPQTSNQHSYSVK